VSELMSLRRCERDTTYGHWHDPENGDRKQDATMRSSHIQFLI